MGDGFEQTQERVGRVIDDEKKSQVVVLDRYIIDKDIKKIPQFDFYAALALAGGQAYTEDVANILKSQGYVVRHPSDVHSLLDIFPGAEWNQDSKGKKSYWKLKKEFFEKEEYKQMLEKSMRKAMNYKTESWVEALMDPSQEGKELHLWDGHED